MSSTSIELEGEMEWVGLAMDEDGHWDWTHRGDTARGRDGRDRAAGLPQSVSEHCDSGVQRIRG